MKIFHWKETKSKTKEHLVQVLSYIQEHFQPNDFGQLYMLESNQLVKTVVTKEYVIRELFI